MAVEPRYGLERLCQLAAEKNRGFNPRVFAQMLARFDRLRREEFELGDTRYAQLTHEVVRWREQSLELARQREIERNRGRDLGLER